MEKRREKETPKSFLYSLITINLIDFLKIFTKNKKQEVWQDFPHKTLISIFR